VFLRAALTGRRNRPYNGSVFIELFPNVRRSIYMGRRRFSPTTFVLIVALLAGLFMVSKQVVPPPAGPPEPPKSDVEMATAREAARTGVKATKPDPKALERGRREMADRQQQYKHQMMTSMLKAKTAPKNPDAVDVTPEYWNTHDMGETGVKEVDQEYKRMKAEQAAALKAQKSSAPAPRMAPMKEPVTTNPMDAPSSVH
jgi:hypothetical protein